MNPKLISLILGLFFFFHINAQIPGNAFSFTCIKKDTIAACSPNCITIITTVPNIGSSTNVYTVNRTNCFRPPVSPAASGNIIALQDDDQYSNELILPFTFPFYSTDYSSLVASSNGYISFDISNAMNFSHYGILSNGFGLSAGSGLPENLPSLLYDKALIMSLYHDLNIDANTSPGRMIKHDLTGVSPHRKWVLSFYKVPLYTNSCNNLIENTHQLVLYESTGIAEVFVHSIQNCNIWNEGRAMIGIQDETKTKAVMAPGRAATDSAWGNVNMNESWRFTPAGGNSLLKKVELYTLGGQLITLGDTLNTVNGNCQVRFRNVCVEDSATYIVKSTYRKFDDPLVEIYGTDTLEITRSNRSSTTIQYSKSTYCITDTSTALMPVINGSTNGTFSANLAGLSINSTTGSISIPGSGTGSYTITYHINTGTGCDATTTIRIADSTQFVWTGAVSNEWENPLNWSCNNLPNSTSQVVIYSGNVVVNSNVNVKKLTVLPGAVVNVNPGFSVVLSGISQ